MKIVKIKIKHGKTEVEIEGPEDFLIKFLNSKDLFKLEHDNERINKSVNSVQKKVKGSRYNDIIGVIKVGGKDGVSLDDIAETTKLTKQQISPILTKAKKNNIIKTIDKGIYVFVDKED